MSEKVVAKAVAFGAACSIAFIAGYIFRAGFGGDRQPVIDAITGANIVETEFFDLLVARKSVDAYEELSKINSMDDVQPLKEKYRADALRRLDVLEREANATKSERKKEMLEPLMALVNENRKRLGDK